MSYEIPEKYIIDIHKKRSQNPFYVEGFNSENDENPYELDIELNMKVIRISQMEPFTEENGVELKKERTKLDNSPYCAWSMGNFIRKKYPWLKN